MKYNTNNQIQKKVYNVFYLGEKIDSIVSSSEDNAKRLFHRHLEFKEQSTGNVD